MEPGAPAPVHSSLPPQPCLSGWVLGLLLPDSSSQLRTPTPTFPSPPQNHRQQPGHVGRKSPPSVLALQPSKGLCVWRISVKNSHYSISRGRGCPCHGLTTPQHVQQAIQQGPLTPIQRMQSFRGCPSASGTMILWEVETDFPNWGLPFLLSMGSANYVPSPIQNPNENDLGSLCFLWHPLRMGIMQSSVSLRSEGFSQPHAKSRQQPGSSTVAPLGLCIRCQGEKPPFFLPLWQL